MKPYIEFKDLSYKNIHRFIFDALHSKQENELLPPLFLLGKAAGYLDIAMALEIITYKQASALLDLIMQYEKEFSTAYYSPV